MRIKILSALLVLLLVQLLLLCLESPMATSLNRNNLSFSAAEVFEDVTYIGPGTYTGDLASGDNYCYKFHVKTGERVMIRTGIGYGVHYQTPSDPEPIEYDVSKGVQRVSESTGYWTLWISSATKYGMYTGPYWFHVSINPASNRIVILIPNSLYHDLSYYIDRYAEDIQSSVGCRVEIHAGMWGSAQDVIRRLKDLYYSSGSLRGCILIGDVPPSAWFEVTEGASTEYFPTDFFYMDLDGIFFDSDGDGYYDRHYGNVEPEIWTGRLKASNMATDEKTLLRKYFDKNHNFRLDNPAPKKALVFADDAFSEQEREEDKNKIGEIYSNRIIVDPDMTCKNEYLQMLQSEHEWVHLHAHGTPNGHSLKVNDYWETVTSGDIQTTSSKAIFYTLGSCSNAKYTESNYIAGWYIFNDGWGLSAFAYTGIGGFSFTHAYGYLGPSDANLLGEASLTVLREASGRYRWEWENLPPDDRILKWIIIGDPTLRVWPSPTCIVGDEDVSVSLGTQVSIHAQLKDDDHYPISGRSIVLEIYHDGSWATIGNATTDENGNVSFAYSPQISAGSYPLRFSFAGDGQYLASSATSSCIIKAVPTTLILIPSSFTIYAGRTQTLTATLTSGGNPLAGKIVSWGATAGNVYPSSDTTNSSGQVLTTYTTPSYATSATITASFAGDSQYTASSDSSTVTIQFSVTLTFQKQDGTPLANTEIYYGTSKEQETSYLGTTDSYGRITSTNSALAGQTLYFKSSDGKYVGSTSVGATGGEVITELTEVSEFPILWVMAAVVIVTAVIGALLLVKKRR